ncbi:MAG TPA: ABC transporter substrate-binding protein [Burkholderiales bacterium]|nr:ABC transporter substrate-binding protein [Burkholderiales bacterium]
MIPRNLRPMLFLIAAMAQSVALAEPGVTKGAILIGQSAPLSGVNAPLGVEQRDGALAYFEFINKQGGVHGRKIVLKTIDDGYVPARTAANVKKLIEEDRVFALFFLRGTSHVAEAVKVFVPAKVPLFSCSCGALSLREPLNPYLFHTRASFQDETDRIIEYLAATGVKRIAIFYQTDGFGKEGQLASERAAKRIGTDIIAQGGVEPNSVDVAKAVAVIAKAEPQAVIMYTLFKPAVEFVRQMKKAGANPTFIALSPVGTNGLVKELGPDSRGIVVSQTVPYPWSPITPVVKEYLNILKENPQTPVGFSTMEAYLAAKVLVEGLRRAGKDLTRDKLIRMMESMKSYDAGGYRVSFSPTNHNGSTYVDLTVIGEGGRVIR